MSITRYVVVGANRGIGLEFVKQLLQNSSNQVVATYRDPTKLDELHALLSSSGSSTRLHLTRLDMNDAQSCKESAEDVKSKFGDIDVLIVNAGVYAQGPLLSLDAKELAGILDNNILGPLRACQAFVPLLNGNTATKNDAASKLILLSSDLSSLEIATQGSEAYSISKAGLNMMGRKLSYELKPSKVAVGLLHPGWVQTDMGGVNASITPKESVRGMLKVIDQLNMTNSGGFWAYSGETHPW